MRRNRNKYNDDEFSFEFDEKEKNKNALFDIDIEKWKILITECLEEVLLKYGFITKNQVLEPRMVSIGELSKDFGVSRQTIINWSNHRHLRILIFPYRKFLGNKFVYNMEGLRKALIMDGPSLGLRFSELVKLRGNPETKE